MTRYDLVILGHGSAAFAAAIKANDLGIKTAIVGASLTNGTLVGGTCVNVGCMPSKRLLTVGTLFYNTTHNSFQGIRYNQGKLDFRKVVRQKDELVRKFRRDKYRRVLDHLKHVTYYEGNGRFESKNKIALDGRTLEAPKVHSRNRRAGQHSSGERNRERRLSDERGGPQFTRVA